MANKAVLTFGVRGGKLSGQHVMTLKGAQHMAKDLVHVFGGHMEMTHSLAKSDFLVSTRNPRYSWQSSTHYVSVQLLTGEGDASALLWKRDDNQVSFA